MLKYPWHCKVTPSHLAWPCHQDLPNTAYMEYDIGQVDTAHRKDMWFVSTPSLTTIQTLKIKFGQLKISLCPLIDN